MSTIKIVGEKEFNFDSVKNNNINKDDEILDSYLDDNNKPKRKKNETYDNFEDDSDLNDIDVDKPEQDILAKVDTLAKEDNPEDRKQRRELKGSIKRYMASIFKEHLSEFQGKNLDLLNVSELQALLDEIEETVDCHENQSFTRESFGMLLGLSETACVNFGIKCKGLQQLICKNEKALRLVDRIALRRRLFIKPEYQLGMIILGTAYSLHKQNEAVEIVNDKNNKEVPKKIVEDYSDLDDIDGINTVFS